MSDRIENIIRQLKDYTWVAIWEHEKINNESALVPLYRAHRDNNPFFTICSSACIG